MTDASDAAGPRGAGPAHGIAPARLEAFSDAVIAIAATVLVLELIPPFSENKVLDALRHAWPALAGYAISFLIIGITWIHHHNLFHCVREVDRALLYLNLGLLGTVAFLPVPTAALGAHFTGDDAVAATVFYCIWLAVTSSWFFLLWNHLQRSPRLLHPAAGSQARRARRLSLLGPGSYLASAALALLTPAGSLALVTATVIYFLAGPNAPTSRTKISAAPGAQ